MATVSGGRITTHLTTMVDTAAATAGVTAEVTAGASEGAGGDKLSSITLGAARLQINRAAPAPWRTAMKAQKLAVCYPSA